ncbi:MAG TPA: inosine/xanthosine triphosphatase [Thermoplasmata archaeon]|nr:inosine/xanthosine triphosphatase [Thermoplasmata archaeon]
MKVCLGGTFDILHAGHEALLAQAFELGDEEVLIGITSDRMARKTRKRVNALAVRKRNLVALLRRHGWKRFRISVLEDVAGPAADEEDLDAIVVSAERATAAHEINQERVRRGHKPMQVFVVPMRLADDCLPVSARRIRAGEIDRKGRMRRPLAVRVGSANPVKVAAVEAIFGKAFPKVRVRSVKVDSKVRAQPYEQETAAGAIARARAAIGSADYGVGIEAGLFWDDAAQDYLDVQYCAIVDKRDLLSVGHGPGFRHPPAILAAVRRGKTVGEAMEELTGIKDVGQKLGAIGWLSAGAMDRRELTESAVLMALVPRIRRDLYFA